MRRIGAPALWALQAYWGNSMVLVCSAGLALAAILPVTSLLHAGGFLDTRLVFSTMGDAVATSGWQPPALTPASAQQAVVQRLFEILFGVMTAVAAVAVLTLVSLFSARASDRATEVAARRAVGASRRVLAGSALLEGTSLAAAGLSLGGVAGLLIGRLALASWPGSASVETPTRSMAALGVMGVIVIFCAMLPLIFARRGRIVDAPGKPIALAVPAMQLGMSLVALAGGELLANQATGGTGWFRFSSVGGDVFRQVVEEREPAVRAGRYAELLDRLAAGGNFDTVSLTSTGAILGLGTVSTVTTDCGLCSAGGMSLPLHLVPATHKFVSPESFRALGVHVIQGRGITLADRWGTTPVAVVSRGLAIRHFQKSGAIGRKILLGDDARSWHTVIGVVDDPPARGLGGSLQPPFTVYASVLQHPAEGVELLLRARGAESVDATAVAAVQRALASGGRPPTRLRESELLAAEMLPLRWFARWLGFEGWVMLVLACGGTFVLMRLWVLSLLSELGVRRAVGARRWRVLGFVLARAAAVGSAGVCVGIWFGPAVWSAIGSVIVGVPAWDTPTVARFAILLVCAAVAGALPPALGAVRTPPATLLA